MSAAEDHDTDAETRALAYALWDEAGKPEGQDAVFWELAEASRREHREPAAAMPDAQGASPTA